jgi:hypothetical protein
LGERRALEQLRGGDVDRAVAWYARNGRITVASTTDDALNAMVNAGMSDVCSGLDSGLYAWRRDNVAALNTAARTDWATDGRLNGPELEAPGGRRYAAGDRIVTLAPGAGGAIVTSERGTITNVDPGRTSRPTSACRTTSTTGSVRASPTTTSPMAAVTVSSTR